MYECVLPVVSVSIHVSCAFFSGSFCLSDHIIICLFFIYVILFVFFRYLTERVWIQMSGEMEKNLKE